MKDGYNREINYMRLSVTDNCNFRCKYCMPTDRVCTDKNTLSFDELYSICKVAVSLGIKKIRITGGEPLLRDGIVDFCKSIASLNGLTELAITTNGSLLKKYAEGLKNAGVSKLNISIDTLDRKKYKSITDTDCYDEVIEGIKLAQSLNFKEIKINVVLIGGFNTDEIESFVELTKNSDTTIRFIELMPIGNCADWDSSHFVSADTVLKAVPSLRRLSFDGVSQTYNVDGYKGKIGLIRPISNKFCDVCNKIRITSDGKIKPCLHSDTEFDLKGLNEAQLYDAIKSAILAKPFSHHLTSNCGSQSKRYMNEIGG